jgi:hypothetical protein
MSMRPAASAASRATLGDELVEKVDDVVVVDQGVGERDEGPADGLFTIGLAHDNSLTRVSASFMSCRG